MGRIGTSELGRVARELSAAGHATPGLSALADGRADARDAFEQVLRELGGGSMSDERAALVLARSFARLLLERESEAQIVTKAIAGLRWRGGAGVDEALAPFARLHERYERADALGPVGDLAKTLLDRRARAAAETLAGSG